MNQGRVHSQVRGRKRLPDPTSEMSGSTKPTPQQFWLFSGAKTADSGFGNNIFFPNPKKKRPIFPSPAFFVAMLVFVDTSTLTDAAVVQLVREVGTSVWWSGDCASAANSSVRLQEPPPPTKDNFLLLPVRKNAASMQTAEAPPPQHGSSRSRLSSSASDPAFADWRSCSGSDESEISPTPLHEQIFSGASAFFNPAGRAGSGRHASCQSPKKPLNAFMLWSRTARRQLAAQHPELHNTDISRLLGRQWRELPEGQRQRCKDAAEALARSAPGPGPLKCS